MDGSTLRGAQVLNSVGDREDQVRMLLGEDQERRRKASFLIADPKRGRVREWPPFPGMAKEEQGNERPPDPITPTFFRGEVLSRFKRHPEKYTLTQTSIECRGAWELRSYDVNEAGQVHAYLKDLRSLPYREQLYWRAFNEAPKAGISERSFAQDFEIRYWEGPDPLRDLTRVLTDFPTATRDGKPVAIWSAGSDHPRRALAGLHYVLTDSPKDWGEEVLELAKVVVEGLSVRELKRVAQALECPEAADPNARSIRLLDAVMRAKGIDSDAIAAVHDPLVRLNRYRSQAGITHRGSDIPQGDLRDHYRHLLEDVAGAMSALADLMRQGYFDLPITSSQNGEC